VHDRSILDDPWRIVLLGFAFVAAVFLPARYHEWPLLGLGAIIALSGAFLEWRKRRMAESWALTSGSVESTDVSADREGYSMFRRWVLQIAYSYQAQDGWHSGYDRRRFRTECAAEEAAAQFRSVKIAIRYNPQSPDESVLADLP
jgi:hypothetical protein